MFLSYFAGLMSPFALSRRFYPDVLVEEGTYKMLGLRTFQTETKWKMAVGLGKYATKFLV